jgi:hypothetical protein
MSHASASANPYTDCCTLVNSKKRHLYNKTIDRSNHTKILQRVLGDEYDHEFFNSNFEWTIRENCCNVIAFTLYFIEPTTEISNKFLFSIERSIKNISNILPDWVIRLYFGSSVFEYLDFDSKWLEGTKTVKGTKKQRRDDDDPITLNRLAFEYICTNPQVELYRFDDRPDVLNIPIEHTRTTRFLPLIDPEVARLFSHEGDGCSNLLLHNLRAWSELPNMLFYLPEYIEVNQVPSDITELPLFSSYSSWLYVFKSILRRYYFHNHHNIYDLLAGGFGTMAKPTKSFYTRTIAELNKSLEDFGNIKKIYKDMCVEHPATKPPSPITFQSFIDRVGHYLIPPGLTDKERTKMIQNLRLGGGDSRLIPVRDDDDDDHEAYRKDRYGVPTTDTIITTIVRGKPTLVSYNFRSFLHRLTNQEFDHSVTEILRMGFDEMLLLDLFKKIISIKIEDDAIDDRGKITITGYEQQISNIKTIIMANYDDRLCLVVINIDKYLIERIQNGLLDGTSSAVNELIDLLYKSRHGLIKQLILPEGGILALNPEFQNIRYSRYYNQFNYLHIYVLIDNILKYIDPTHPAINIRVHIINGDNSYTDFNLLELLNIPFSPIIDPLYDLPLKIVSPAGGSKRDTITSLIIKRTTRRKKRSYRSRKKSYRKYNKKKTYKYNK